MKPIQRLLLLWLLLLSGGPMQAQRILFVGDSITDGGWGRSAGSALASAARNHSDLNHLYGHSYMMLCAAHYTAYRPEADCIFFNRGVSGDDLARLEARWECDVLDLHPDVLSLLIGTNDVHYYLQAQAGEPFDYTAWEHRYRALLDRARAANPALQLLLGTPFTAAAGKFGTADDYAIREAIVQQLAAIVVRIAADYGAAVLRYDLLFAEQAQRHPAVPVSHWIWDGIHPTAAGHRLMADLWTETFDGLTMQKH